LHEILRCVHVAGGFLLSRRLPTEEIWVVELFALTSEELSLEPVELLREDQYLILQLAVLLF
jgi:hypothetical protein